MIPKKIHYIWLGGKPLTDLGQKCLESWKKYCPDYEIIRWDESNFDINQNIYCREAYENKKYAFASDYIRLWVLYNHGGIYMDTDVEILRNPDMFLAEKAFSGFENAEMIPTGIMACEKDNPLFKEFLEYYDGRRFVKEEGGFDSTTNVKIITDICLGYGLIQNNQKQTVKDMTFYPNDFFCPKDYATRELYLTKNSVAIHHFDGSWLKAETRLYLKYKEKYGKKTGKILFVLFHPVLAWKRGRRKK